MSGTTLTTTTEPADQPFITSLDTGTGDTDQSPQADNALLPPGSAPFYVFSIEYRIIFNGVLIEYRPGVGYQLDPALLAFLNAQSAPITAV